MRFRQDGWHGTQLRKGGTTVTEGSALCVLRHSAVGKGRERTVLLAGRAAGVKGDIYHVGHKRLRGHCASYCYLAGSFGWFIEPALVSAAALSCSLQLPPVLQHL